MKEKMFNEAIERMELLNMSKQCIKAFKEGEVWESEGIGALYQCNEEENNLIKEFESKHNCLVYHMIHAKYEFGECYTMMIVTDEESEWKRDKEDLKNGYAFAYVKNIDDEWCSEYGTVGIRQNIGGLIRIS